MDKAFWQAIIANDCAVPDGHSVVELTPHLIDLLASSDPVLRDDVAYLVFARWIVRDEHYSPDALRQLIDTLTANLQSGLGKRETESVLLRSFSALTLSLIAYYDVQKPFLSHKEVQALLNTAIDYLRVEQDLRGYVEGIGWHHAMAHTADLLKFLARNPKITSDDHRQILDAIFDKLATPVDTVYVHDEDERLVLAVYDILRRDTLDVETWQAWLARFREWKQQTVSGEAFVITIHAPYMNLKHFIRSLYFNILAIIEKGKDLGAAHEMALTIQPDVLETAYAFGAGTIYTA